MVDRQHRQAVRGGPERRARPGSDPSDFRARRQKRRTGLHVRMTSSSTALAWAPASLATVGRSRGPDVGDRRTEHQPVERGVFESETDIRSTDRGEQRFRVVDSRHRAQHAVAQSFEAHGGDGGEKIQLLGKMIVGRAVAHAGAACHLSEREGPVLLLGDQLQRGVDQGATEVAVMIGLRVARRIFFGTTAPEMLTMPTSSCMQCLHRRSDVNPSEDDQPDCRQTEEEDHATDQTAIVDQRS